MNDNNNVEEHWRLDKKIPLAPLIMLIAYTFGIFWWGAKLDGRVALMELKAAEYDRRFEVYDRDRDTTRDRLTLLEAQIKSILDTVNRIDRRLDPRRPDATP